VEESRPVTGELAAPVLRIGGPESLAMGALAFLLGVWMRGRFRVLEEWSIPASVAGGLCIAAVLTGLRGRVVNVEADTSLRDLLSIICFTIIGLNASMSVLIRGGAAIPLLLLLAGIGAALQNTAGVLLAWTLGLNPLTGPLAGSISLNGGPATSVAFGAVFEKEGVAGATSIAVASATFGIAVAGLLAGRAGQFLIQRFAGGAAGIRVTTNVVVPRTMPQTATTEPGNPDMALLQHALTIAICIGFGSLVSLALQRAGITVPSFIGPMTVAAIWRNCNDRLQWQQLSETTLREIFQVALPLFIGVAIATLKLWELASLALPLLVILLAQVAITTAFCIGAFFVMRKAMSAYEASIVCTGFVGFMLGITPNAMASMEELTAKHGPAPQAFLTVPIVGGYLNDFVNSVVITGSIVSLRMLQ
jgi:glutamate:Na+ symporter, ESS family